MPPLAPNNATAEHRPGTGDDKLFQHVPAGCGRRHMSPMLMEEVLMAVWPF
jgi:hypothetical protein